jgi:hypothetical protein
MRFRNTTFEGSPTPDPGVLARLPVAYAALVRDVNGFVAYDGGFHVRGVCTDPKWHSLQEALDGEYAIHRLYGGVEKTDIPFAEDCLGDQFLLRGNDVLRLSAETGDVRNLGMTLQTFLERAEAQPMQFLQLHPLVQFMRDGGRLEPGQHILAWPPFCTSEGGKHSHLSAVPSLKHIGFLAEVARQIKALPNGTKFTIKWID